MANEPRFTFKLYSPRWGRDDIYSLNVNASGWHVSHLSISGDCDRRGKPYLFDNFKQDSIQYPSGLGIEMELLFEKAIDGTGNDKLIQTRLDRLARWVEDVNAVERPDFED